MEVVSLIIYYIDGIFFVLEFDEVPLFCLLDLIKDLVLFDMRSNIPPDLLEGFSTLLLEGESIDPGGLP